LIDQALQAMQGEKAATGQLAPIASALQGLYGQEQGQMGISEAQRAADQARANALSQQGDVMLGQATTGTGLYPSQQAMIDAQVNAAKNTLAQNLGTMGLGTSTMGAELGGEIGLQGGATAGQLVQGNIAAAQQEQQLGLSAQQVAQQQQQMTEAFTQIAQGNTALQAGVQQQLFTQLGAIATQHQALQAQTFQEAMMGQGMVGQLMNSMAQAWGAQLGGEQQFLQASEANANVSVSQAQLQAGINAQNQQAASAGMGGLFQGLGALFGGGGGGGGGLLGGLGGLLGGGGGAASLGTLGGAEAATAAGVGGGGLLGSLGGAIGGAVSGIGSGIGAVASALTAAF
jgi:hypothetical protein